MTVRVAESAISDICASISAKSVTLALRLLAPSALILGLTATSASALTINDTFLSTFTGTSFDEAQVIAATNAVASLFSNSATINILIGADSSLGSGAESITAPYYQSYSNYVALLQKNSLLNPANTTLATAVANLPNGNGGANPLTVVSTPAQLQALGVNVPGTIGVDSTGNIVSGTFDGIINIGLTADISALFHEVDEILGGGGQGSYVGSQPFCSSFAPAGCYGALDLYRYSAPGVGSFDPNASAAYFSVDGGVTDIANFNQSGTGDYGDFTTSPCLIQSWEVCSPAPTMLVRGSPEDQMLESIGYDPVATPLPSSWTMMLAALIGFGFIAYRDASKRSGILAAT